MHFKATPPFRDTGPQIGLRISGDGVRQRKPQRSADAEAEVIVA